MAGLIVQIEETPGSGVWVDMRARFNNLTGTPVVSVTPLARGQLIAGVYVLTFSGVTAGDEATCKVETDLSFNPYRDQIGKTVQLDAATAALDIIEGLAIVFDDDVGFNGTWSVRIKVGLSLGAIAAYPPSAGSPGSSRKLRLFNDTGKAIENLRVRNGLTQRAKHFPTTSTLIFDQASDTADSAVEILTDEQVQPYHITVESVTGSGSSKTMDLLVEGETVRVRNPATGETGDGTALNVNDSYEIVSSGLSGLRFKLSQQATNTSTANVLIFGPRFLQTAGDLGGAPGDWGTDDVYVTQDGQATGTLQDQGFGFVHVRPLVPDQSTSKSNPYIVDLEIIADVSAGANWSG